MDPTEGALRRIEISRKLSILFDKIPITPGIAEALETVPLSVLSRPSFLQNIIDGYNRTFAIFPLLPEKIRSNIWRIAVKDIEPRRVALHEHFQPNGEFTGIRSNCELPALLRVCKDSREAVLKRFEKAFGFTYKSKDFPASVYFNYESDILVFRFNSPRRVTMDLPYFAAIVREESLKKIQSLEIDERDIILRRAIDELLNFTSLRKLVILPMPAEFLPPENWIGVSGLSNLGQKRLNKFLSGNPHFKDTVEIKIENKTYSTPVMSATRATAGPLVETGFSNFSQNSTSSLFPEPLGSSSAQPSRASGRRSNKRALSDSEDIHPPSRRKLQRRLP